MSDHPKKLMYRCPLCLFGGNDVYLKQTDEVYSCMKCSFTGSEADIIAMYDDYRKRYRLMEHRITLDMQRKM